MSKDDLVEKEGIVRDGGVQGIFKVELVDHPGQFVTAHLGGKIRQNNIRVTIGDRVTVGLSPYDLSRGRITYRHKV